MTVRIALAVRSDRADAINAAINAGSGPGKLQIRTGAQPATPETTASGTLILDFVLNDPAFTESGAVLTADVSPAITDDALADAADITTGHGRFTDSDGNGILDLAYADGITLSDTSLETGQTVTLISATITEPV